MDKQTADTATVHIDITIEDLTLHNLRDDLTGHQPAYDLLTKNLLALMIKKELESIFSECTSGSSNLPVNGLRSRKYSPQITINLPDVAVNADNLKKSAEEIAQKIHGQLQGVR